MLPAPQTSFRLALGAGLVSAAFVLAWVAYASTFGPGPAIPPVSLIVVGLLGMLAAPILGLLALSLLLTYRVQVEPCRERTMATLAVTAAVAPTFLATAWIVMGLVFSLTA